MKDIKCPLCGTQLKQFSDMHDNYHVRVGCGKCKWTTFLCAPHLAWDAAKEFIFRFPPIMRVHVGDKLTYFGTSDFVTVIYKDKESCEIQVETPEGELYIIEPKDVHKWPWELEQKGGE